MRRSAVRGVSGYLLPACAILLVVMGKFLLFQAAYLYKDIASDSINIVYPRIRHLFDYLRTDGIPGWSFNQGLGQDIFPFSWNDPFYAILIPFRGAGLSFGIAYMEAAKILSAGILFYFYLRELRLKERAAVAGALLFSFSGYIVLGSAWTVFSTEAVYCAFLLYAFERFLKRDSWSLLPAPIALLGMLQPFLLYPYALFFFLYATIRFFDGKNGRLREYGTFMLRFASLAALGVAISGVFSFSEARQMLQSPRVGGHASHFGTLFAKSIFTFGTARQGVTALLRLYSSDLLGTGSGFRGWGNYLEAPLFYCGLVCLLLAPLAFAAMDRRRRGLYGALAALVLLPVVFPYARYAFWAFHGGYYRTLSLFVVVILIYLSANGLNRINETGKVDRAVLAGSLATALILLYAVSSSPSMPIDQGRRAVAAALLVAYAVLLFLMGSRRLVRTAGAALLILICIEAAWSSWRTMNARDVAVAGKTGYEDSTENAVAFIRSSDPSFYRIEKDYSSGTASHASLNDAEAQGYYGTSSYSQFNQASYVEFLGELGVLDPARESDTRWIVGLRSREKLMSLVGVKYFLSKRPAKVPPLFTRDPVGVFGDVSVFRNRSALPLGFTYDRCLPLRDFRALDATGKDAALLDAFVSEDDACLGFPRFNTASAVRARTNDTLLLTTRSQNIVEGRIALQDRKLVFFSIPFDTGWTARVDGAAAPLMRVDAGFMGLLIGPGQHHVELRFASPLRGLGTAVSLAGLALYALLLLPLRRFQRRDP